MNRTSKPSVAFVTSHPIQYQVPVFRHLAQRDDMEFQVLFAMLPDAAAQGAGFSVDFQWDVPLLEGYQYSVLKNVSADPGVTHYRGCDTPGIAAELKQRKTDVVIVNGWVVKTCLQTLWACKRLQIPCIVRGEANLLRPRAWWKKTVQKRLVRQFDAFLPIGTANREFYRNYGVLDSRMFDAPYCVENDRFTLAATAAAPQRDTLRLAWGIPTDSLCLLFCGKFETKKHPLELLHAFEKAYHSSSNLHLLMVGDGELRRECQRFAEAKSLPVTFAGFLNQSEIVDAYVAADTLVLPSDHGETWGLVVNEAMACGLPAIVSDQIGCAFDLIVNGKTGWVFPFGQWDQLAELMVQVSVYPEQLQSMRAACQELISDYSPLVAAEGIVAATKQLTSAAHERKIKR
ncbi:GDP-mannose-dependent alpha-(1-6)-phosphatidylinositol dimannoside mannosyltransferase [Novipirellula galeiformis]|uniref:GDP-mannose-dependent alpha-(1-6)-phosphatidylinositol dimannoside mannosyltransferase n=1 Tax=Novipirellula galeiformis TaxID=2528004 RepID=A0A5C6CQE0_9BACT|nr:glycosyltransferase family 4 protein [Novipirellula galeiformis]TWU27163.1 GDP-mannose-dependent alpha-(1-6)-phosphatidylinositol dimannoside mannosyltransferase [Novipirellula galeiformis]